MAEQAEIMRDVVVVGGGAAGLSAALTLARAHRRVTVVDAGAPRNAPADGVHGLLALDGLSPVELLARGRAEVTGYGGEIIAAEVSDVSCTSLGFAVVMRDGGVLHARRLLIATGVVDELPKIPGLRERWGRDVLHCPYCHGWEVRDRRIGVLATGPMSVHQALLFRQWSETGVRLGDGRVVEVEALAVASRMVARADVFAGIGIEATAHPVGSYIAADPTGRTSVPGVWVAGNSADLSAQASAAAADGARAAAHINADLVAEDTDRAVARLSNAEMIR